MKASTELLKEFADAFFDINLSSIDNLYSERKKYSLKAGFGVLCTSDDRLERREARAHIRKTLDGIKDSDGIVIYPEVSGMIEGVASNFKSNFQADETETHEIFFYVSRMFDKRNSK